MEMYFFKSAACLALLLLFYKLLLEQQNMHVFKRFYLLTSVVAAIIIPLITFTTYIKPSSEVFDPVFVSSEAAAEITPASDLLPYLLVGIYLLGVLFFSIKFFGNLRHLILKIRNNPKIRQNNFTNVLLSEKTPPHTFFSFIFFNKKKYLHNEIPEDVKIHEEAHARQKHSLDVIFVELLQIIFWINPLIFLLKNSIKLNHEFLADRAVIQQGISTSRYQHTLLSYSSGDLQSDLVNPINYSSIKKRFTVMKTQTSKKTVWARSLSVLPLLALLLYGFGTKEVLYESLDQQQKIDTVDISTIIIEEDIDIEILKNGDILVNQQIVKIDELKKRLSKIIEDPSPITQKQLTTVTLTISPEVEMGLITDVKTHLREFGVLKIKTFLSNPPQDKNLKRTLIEGNENLDNSEKQDQDQKFATPEMIAEYNKLVKYYNSLPREKHVVKQEDANRIMYILGRMTPEQKRNAEKIKFNVPPPPPPAPAPENAPEPENVMPVPPPPPKEAGEIKDVADPEFAPAVAPPPAPPAPAVKHPQIPPPPPPPTYEDLVEKGATFYYNGKQIKPEEARKLVEVDKKVNIHITDLEGKPVVRLTDKDK